MLAACFEDTDGWLLLLGRVSILFVAGFGLYVVGRMLYHQPVEQKGRIVPRPVLVFTALWLLLLLAVTVVIMVDGCDTPLTPVKRTVFGASLTWSLAGMSWVGMYGARWKERVTAKTREVLTVTDLLKEAAESERAAS